MSSIYLSNAIFMMIILTIIFLRIRYYITWSQSKKYTMIFIGMVELYVLMDALFMKELLGKSGNLLQFKLVSASSFLDFSGAAPISKGNSTTKVDPFPTSLVTEIVPPILFTNQERYPTIPIYPSFFKVDHKVCSFRSYICLLFSTFAINCNEISVFCIDVWSSNALIC